MSFHVPHETPRSARSGLTLDLTPGEGVGRSSDESTHLLKRTEDSENFYAIRPLGSVYSLLLFVPPVEQCRTGRNCTQLIVFIIFLVCTNFVMQFGLLYVVGHHVVEEHETWVTSIANIDTPVWYHLHKAAGLFTPSNHEGTSRQESFLQRISHAQGAKKKCRQSNTLCEQAGSDDWSCAPASVLLLGDWDTLDYNGDGTWSREEANNETYREEVICSHGLDPVVLYDNILAVMKDSPGLANRLHPSLVDGSGMQKAYLDWFKGTPLMCMYGDADNCGVLFERGYFDEALRHGTFKPMSNLRTAREYCYELLSTQCEAILPSTYRVWKTQAAKQCGDKTYTPISYESPTHDADKMMLKVEYSAVSEYAKTRSWTFPIYVVLLLLTFYNTMWLEFKSIIKVFHWAWEFPSDPAGVDDATNRTTRVTYSADDDLPEEEGDKKIDFKHMRSMVAFMKAHPSHGGSTPRIHSVRRDHRWLVLIVTFFRIVLWVFLLYVGTLFLTSDTKYLNLIFDALSLVFIINIDELLYETMVRVQIKDDHEHMEEMKIIRRSSIPVVQFDLLMSFFLILSCVVVIMQYCTLELEPLSRALECVCDVSGPNCVEARTYDKAWWDNYWTHVLPQANKAINELLGN